MDFEAKLRTVSAVTRGPLALVDDETRRELARRAEVRSYRFGDTVYSAGDVGQAMYFVVTGKARIVGLDPTGHEVTLAVLRRAGDHFGQDALLSGGAHATSVRAAEDLVLLRVSRADFEATLGRLPGVLDVLERYEDDAAVRDFLKQFTALGTLPAHVLRGLVAELEEVRAKKGTVVIHEGDAADRCYVVRRGLLDVFKAEPGGGRRLVGHLAEGELFGELALLAGTLRTATVEAASDCELLAVSRTSLDRVMAASPDLRSRLEEHAAAYRRQVTEPSVPAALARDPRAQAGGRGPDDAEAEEPERATAPIPRRSRWNRLLNRYPFIEQNDETDCAAACLAMIARFHGVPVGLARLRDLANVDADGATLWSVAEAAEKLGFHARGLHLSYQALSDLELPAIVHWEGYHYIVLHAVGRRGVVVGDPALGVKRMTEEEFRRGWTGRALELRATPRLHRVERLERSWRRLTGLLRPNASLLGEILLASLLLNVLGLGLPFFTQVVIDRVLVAGSVDLLDMMLVAMVLVAFFQGAVGFARQWLLVHVASHADTRLLGDFFRHVLDLPLRFFDLRRVGDIVSRVQENTKIRDALVGTLPGVVLDTALGLGYFALMAWYDVRLTLVVAAVVPFFALLMFAFTPALRRTSKELFARHALAWSYLIEAVTGIGTVKATGVESTVRWRLESLFADSIEAARRCARVDAVYSTLAGGLQAFSAALFLWFGAHRVLDGELTTGQLLAFTTLAASVVTPVQRLVEAWDTLQEVRIALDRLSDVLDATPEEKVDRETLRLRRLAGRIVFDKVSFQYSASQDRPTLDGVSFEIEAGTTVAIVGRSGSGKSTIAKLVMGLYTPRKGRILVDGHDLRTLSRRALRRRIGVVPQEVFLFSGTIRENIALGDPDIPMDRVVEAAKLAGAHEFTCEMALGYDTKVGERGMSLSGGQRQRIALARALLHDPDLLILDEATSALDTESERAIQRSLHDATRGRTVIVIAHRLSTVRDADRILVLDSANLVEQGTHAELVALGGLYSLLVGQQVSE